MVTMSIWRYIRVERWRQRHRKQQPPVRLWVTI